jgi:hypothetical protein
MIWLSPRRRGETGSIFDAFAFFIDDFPRSPLRAPAASPERRIEHVRTRGASASRRAHRG